MKRVQITIKTNTKGPARKKKGFYQYVLECEIGGKVHRKEGTGNREDTCENELSLLAFSEALERFREPCLITVNTTCGTILNACRNGWVKKWKEQGWKNAKGKKVRYPELWEKVAKGMELHNMTFREPEEREEKME